MNDDIDYEALKQRGFLQQKQKGFFLLRTRGFCGNYTPEHLVVLSKIAGKYGKGIIHATTRQGLEIPFIQFKDIDAAEQEMLAAGIQPGASGPRLRVTTSCPGNNWCKMGLIDTFSLCDKIEKELGVVCGMALPHKFKIAVSGCRNKCTRADASEIGIHGQADGYAVYLGGCGGKAPQAGIKLDKTFNLEEVLALIQNVVLFFKQNAQPRQRLSALIEAIGEEAFLKAIGV